MSVDYRTETYDVQPNYGAERTADYKRAQQVIDQWEVVDDIESASHGTCGNLKPQWKDGVCEIAAICAWDDNAIPFYRKISSALFLYRLGCHFAGRPMFYGHDGYKCTWSFALRHKASGEVAIFGDFKGAQSMWTKHGRADGLDKTYLADLAELCDYLCSPNCAHPYDGTVAGSVA